MEDLEALCNKAREEISKDVAVNEATLAVIPVVAGVMQQCLDKLADQMPDKGQINVSGWWSSGETPSIYGSVRLYYDDQKSMKDSAEVLEALDGVIPLEMWQNVDLPASMTRAFQCDYTIENQPPTNITVHVYWAVTEGLESGCSKRLVRVDREMHTSERNVYEIVCGESA